MADEPSTDARPPPLRLPVGSVRALITLAVLGTVWVQLLRGKTTSEELRDTMLLVLGYYFGVQRLAKADAFAPQPERTSNEDDPMHLPMALLRALIVVGFGAVAWKLHQAGKLLPDPPPMLVLAVTFLGGAIARSTVRAVGGSLPGRLGGCAGHLAAAVTLLVVFGFCGVELLERRAAVPHYTPVAFMAVIGFYLGKR
jgi:hypothetical protein